MRFGRRDHESFIGGYDPEHEMPNPDRDARDRYQSDAYRDNARDSRYAYRWNPDRFEDRGGEWRRGERSDQIQPRDRYSRWGSDRSMGMDRGMNRGREGGYGFDRNRGLDRGYGRDYGRDYGPDYDRDREVRSYEQRRGFVDRGGRGYDAGYGGDYDRGYSDRDRFSGRDMGERDREFGSRDFTDRVYGREDYGWRGSERDRDRNRYGGADPWERHDRYDRDRFRDDWDDRDYWREDRPNNRGGNRY